MTHKFITEHAAFISENVKGRGTEELTKMFNQHFGLELSQSQIRSYKKNHKLSSGLDGRFKPGNVPFNKGTKGVSCGGKSTWFKKGNNPHNYKPIGTERVNGDGYVDIKVSEPNKWKGKHLVIWEKENGPVPKGHAVIFGDGNRRNFDPDNLILVSKKQLAMLNKHRLIQNDADLTRAGIMIADIYKKIGERKKRK